jgi:hypothetical protein
MKLRSIVFIILIISAAVALPALPTSDARYLDIEISYRLQNDGSWDMEYRHRVRLDTYFAVNRALGETFIVYNPDLQKLEILKAETTMADGRKVAAPDNAFNEVLPFAAHGFADFAHLREMVVTHTGLERGALVDLHYRIHTRAGLLPAFTGREVLVRDFPVDRYRLTIAVPSGRELRFRVFNVKSEAEVSPGADEKRYTFAMAALPAAVHEPQVPAQAEPFIVFSASADWQQALAMNAAPSPLPAVLAAKVETLKAQYPARPDLLAALQRSVAVEMQNCGLGVEATGWQPRPLERVFAGNYGTRLEKALLLRALLKNAGIDAELLAVAAGGSFAATVPSPLQLNDFWLKVGEGPHVLHLDPCHEQQEFFPYRGHGVDAVNLERMETEKMPAADWNQSGVDVSGAVQLDTAGVSGTLVVTARGTFNRYNEATADTGKFIAAVLRKIFPVEKVEIKKLLALTRRETRAEVTFSGKWLKDAGAGFFSVDACRLPGVSETMVQLAQRELPLALDAPFKVSLELDLQPAAGLNLDYSAPPVDLTNEAGYFVRKLSRQKDGLIRFSEGCGILNNPVRVETYPRLRELFKAYFTPDFWLVLKKSN